MMTAGKPYPSDGSDDEWALVAPYLILLHDIAEQRGYLLHEVFNGLRYLVCHRVAWRAIPPLAFHRLSPTEPWPATPSDLAPWHAVYDQAQRWLRAGCFEMLAHNLRAVICERCCCPGAGTASPSFPFGGSPAALVVERT